MGFDIAALWACCAGWVWAQASPMGLPVPPTTAEQAVPLSLRDLITRIRESNKDVKIKRTETEIARTGIDRASAAF